MRTTLALLLAAGILAGCGEDPHIVCVEYNDRNACQRFEPTCKAWVRESSYGNYKCER
jgi:hypothetical protein